VSNPMSISKLVEAAASTVMLEADEDGGDELHISVKNRRSTVNKSGAMMAPLVTNMLITGGRNRRVSSNSQQGKPSTQCSIRALHRFFIFVYRSVFASRCAKGVA
jgi:hypothetical protein